MAASYDFEGFWRAVTRNGRAGCWVCEHLPGLGMHRRAEERERCEFVSGGRLPDAHHLLSKHTLKKECPTGRNVLDAPEVVQVFSGGAVPPATEGPAYRHVSLEHLLSDPRNGIPVARFHHDALESRRIRIPRHLLPAPAVEFATELGLLPLLERYYPEEV